MLPASFSFFLLLHAPFSNFPLLHAPSYHFWFSLLQDYTCLLPAPLPILRLAPCSFVSNRPCSLLWDYPYQGFSKELPSSWSILGRIRIGFVRQMIVLEQGAQKMTKRSMEQGKILKRSMEQETIPGAKEK